MAKFNLKLWKDILTEKVGNEKIYSQARFYLLVSIVAYYITLGLITWKSLHPNSDISETALKTIIEALQWAIALFSGYCFGGKIVEGVKTVLNKSTPDPQPVVPDVQPEEPTEK